MFAPLLSTTRAFAMLALLFLLTDAASAAPAATATQEVKCGWVYCRGKSWCVGFGESCRNNPCTVNPVLFFTLFKLT